MILLEETLNPILLWDSPLTDWIQTFAALIAIAAGLWGFIKLWKKDKDKEERIRLLTNLAEESEKQTLELSRQVVELRQNNKHLEKFVQLMAKSIDFSEQNLNLKKEILEYEINQEKLKMKPDIRIEPGLVTNERITRKLKIYSEYVRFIEVKETSENEMHHNFQKLKDAVLHKDNYFEFELRSKIVGKNARQSKPDINFIIEDRTNNKYKMRLFGIPMKIEIDIFEESK